TCEAANTTKRAKRTASGGSIPGETAAIELIHSKLRTEWRRGSSLGLSGRTRDTFARSYSQLCHGCCSSRGADDGPRDGHASCDTPFPGRSAAAHPSSDTKQPRSEDRTT